MSAVTQVATLKCTAGRGMFPHEATILIRGIEQFYESLLDRDLLTIAREQTIGETDVPATVSVGVVKVNGTAVLVELPRQVVSGGGRRIWVSKSEVDSYGPIVPSRDRTQADRR
jgi:hypothetical protein